MSIRRTIKSLIGSRQNIKYSYTLDDPVHLRLTELAAQENRTLEQVTADVLAAGLIHYQIDDDLHQRWDSLTQREREVIALICLGYKRNQIAEILGITPGTVKSHVESIFEKFNVHTSRHLSDLLKDWNFSQWWEDHHR